MKTKFFKRVLWLMIPLLTIFTTNVWGAEETLTIDYYSFSSHGTSYTEKSWSGSTSVNHTSISGSGNVCFTSNQTYVQIKNNHPGIANSTALPGAIKSIAIKKQSGTNRTLYIYAGTSALTSSNYTSGTNIGSKTVDEYGVTWFFTPEQIAAGYTYFYIYGSSNALLTDEIVITFDNGESYDYELVTDASTLSVGDIIVFANTANTAVASTFVTSNTYLAKETATISGTTLTTSKAMEFTLGGSSGSWTFTNGMSTLRATSTTALAMGGSSGVETWTISISSNNATVAPSSNYQTGTIRYNTGSPRFKNYTSGQAVIQIYKKLPCAAIDVTGGSAVILPAGSTTYSTGDWGVAGAPSSYAAEQTLPIGSNHYCVSFTQAYENNQANGLQVRASDGIVSITDITSSYGIEVEISCSGSNGFQVALTGATTLTGQSGTVTISTTNTSADLTISKNTSNVGYIKYIKITPKAACVNGTVSYAKGSVPSGGGAISGSHANDTKVCGTDLTLPGVTFTTTGYTQDGWATSDGGSKVYNLSATDYSTEGNATLYPHWSVNTYTVTWSVNNSNYSAGTPSTSVNHGSHVSSLPTPPDPEDYCGDVFVGWTTVQNYVHNTSPLYTTAGDFPNATDDQVFYSVFADED